MKEPAMKAHKFLTGVAALALLSSTGVVLSQSETKDRTPGQQMQNPTTEPKEEGSGASGYAPGRQERSPDSKGASESAPGQGGVNSTAKPGTTKDTTDRK
jgi:hypothetical protein